MDRSSQIPIDQLIIQRLARLEERVTRLEKEREESQHMTDFFDSINGSELYNVLSKRLEECYYSISDVCAIQFQADGAGYVILTDEKRVNFSM